MYVQGLGYVRRDGKLRRRVKGRTFKAKRVTRSNLVVSGPRRSILLSGRRRMLTRRRSY